MVTENLIPEALVDLRTTRTVAVVRIHVAVLIVIVVDIVLDHVHARVAVRTANRDILDQSRGLILVVIAAAHEVHGMEASGELLAMAIIRSPIDAWAFSDLAFIPPNVKFVRYSQSMAIWKAFK